MVSWKAASLVHARLVSEISITSLPEVGTYSTIGRGGKRIDREGRRNCEPM
jgi:hypothetical protein